MTNYYYVCEYGCGFNNGIRDIVVQHETQCRLKPPQDSSREVQEEVGVVYECEHDCGFADANLQLVTDHEATCRHTVSPHLSQSVERSNVAPGPCTSGKENCYCRRGARVKSVVRIDEDNRILERYCTETDAASKLGIRSSTVSAHLHGRIKTVGGHVLRFEDPATAGDGGKKAVLVINQLEGHTEEFSCAKDAQRSTGISNTTIGRVCNSGGGLIKHIFFQWKDPACVVNRGKQPNADHKALVGRRFRDTDDGDTKWEVLLVSQDAEEGVVVAYYFPVGSAKPTSLKGLNWGDADELCDASWAIWEDGKPGRISSSAAELGRVTDNSLMSDNTNTRKKWSRRNKRGELKSRKQQKKKEGDVIGRAVRHQEAYQEAPQLSRESSSPRSSSTRSLMLPIVQANTNEGIGEGNRSFPQCPADVIPAIDQNLPPHSIPVRLAAIEAVMGLVSPPGSNFIERMEAIEAHTAPLIGDPTKGLLIKLDLIEPMFGIEAQKYEVR